jgi:pimeloyl-ACP methyl ester carboxylesterase
VAYLHLRARAGTTALTLVGVIPGPDPAWGDAAARDLYHLVENAGLKRPLVLVGASFGGHIIRLYHHMYPGEVSGMVFADTALEDAGTIQGMPYRERPPIPRSVIRGLSIILGRLGMMRFLRSDPGPPPKHWSADEWDILGRLGRQRKVLLADARLGPGRATDDLVRSTGGLEDMPSHRANARQADQGSAFSRSGRTTRMGGPPASICGAFSSRTSGVGSQQWTRYSG